MLDFDFFSVNIMRSYFEDTGCYQLKLVMSFSINFFFFKSKAFSLFCFNYTVCMFCHSCGLFIFLGSNVEKGMELVNHNLIKSSTSSWIKSLRFLAITILSYYIKFLICDWQQIYGVLSNVSTFNLSIRPASSLMKVGHLSSL